MTIKRERSERRTVNAAFRPDVEAIRKRLAPGAPHPGEARLRGWLESLLAYVERLEGKP